MSKSMLTTLCPVIIRNGWTSSRHMSVRARKKFYKDVSVLNAGGGQYELTLDSRKLKTPGGEVFSVNSEALAKAVAHEWQTQEDKIILSQMHLTGLCNRSIDNPTKVSKYELVDSTLGFLDTDTILFFSDEPPGLIKKQKEEWQPIIEWFCDRHQVDIEPSTSIAPPKFSPKTREAIRRHMLSYSLESVHGISFGADALKSVLLMFAVVDKRLTVKEAVSLARLETNFQTEQWGNVEWAHDLELHYTTARVAASSLFVQAQTSQHLRKEKS